MSIHYILKLLKMESTTWPHERHREFNDANIWILRLVCLKSSPGAFYRAFTCLSTVYTLSIHKVSLHSLFLTSELPLVSSHSIRHQHPSFTQPHLLITYFHKIVICSLLKQKLKYISLFFNKCFKSVKLFSAYIYLCILILWILEIQLF